MSGVTQTLSKIQSGDAEATEQLLPLVYDELRRLAAARLANEPPGLTLQATALVHEAYLRLVDVDRTQSWDSRGHFFGASAESMRRILVERARRKMRPKHGGDRRRVDLREDHASDNTDASSRQVIALSEALDQLHAEDPAKAELVKLRFFAGLSLEEAATVIGISRATAARYWTYAKTWLYCAIEDIGEICDS